MVLWEKSNHVLSLVKLSIGLLITESFLRILAMLLTQRGTLKVNRIEMQLVALPTACIHMWHRLLTQASFGFFGVGEMYFFSLFVSIPRFSFRF